MMHHDGMLPRDLVEVVDVELAFVRHLGVVEEVAFHPGAGRGSCGLLPQFFDDAVDGDEFHLERISHQRLIQEYLPFRMIVAVDETRQDRHLLRVEHGCIAARQIADVRVAADGLESSPLDGECLGPRQMIVDGVDPGIDDDQIRPIRTGHRLLRPRCQAWRSGPEQGTGPAARQCEKSPAIHSRVVFHGPHPSRIRESYSDSIVRSAMRPSGASAICTRSVRSE